MKFNSQRGMSQELTVPIKNKFSIHKSERALISRDKRHSIMVLNQIIHGTSTFGEKGLNDGDEEEQKLNDTIDEESSLESNEGNKINRLEEELMVNANKSVSSESEGDILRQEYLDKIKKEVDFHHKVAYRFEKAYRLGKR